METLELDILGSHPITFTVGVLTGKMLKEKKYGIGIRTVLYEDGKMLGGAITYEDCIALRDFMNNAITALDEINSSEDWR